MTKELTIDDLAKLFGTTSDDLSEKCSDLISSCDLSYRDLDSDERDQVLLDILKKIDSSDLKKAGESRKEDWINGWQENLDEFISSEYNLKTLIPKYFKTGVHARFDGDFIYSDAEMFVFNEMDIFREWLFKTYFSNFENIYEFGCGTGHHLVKLASIYPNKNYYGFDWAEQSQDILSCIKDNYQWNIVGKKYDYFAEKYDIEIKENSAVFTFTSLEQVGEKYKEFVDFLLEQKPKLVLNIEPLDYVYDTNQLSDYLGKKYHEKRNYLKNYAQYLMSLEEEEKIEILKCHHHPFGNLFNDTWSYIVWKVI